MVLCDMSEVVTARSSEMAQPSNARVVWLFALLYFFIVPSIHLQGLFFVNETLNGAVAIAWYLAPFIVLGALVKSRKWWWAGLASIICLGWLPITAICLLLYGDWQRLSNGQDPFLCEWELVPEKSALVKHCTYMYDQGGLGMSFRETRETEAIPYIKYVEPWIN